MPSIRSYALAVLLAMSLVLGVTAAAQAQVRVMHDQVGDGVRSPDHPHRPGRWGDIARVRIANQEHALRVKMIGSRHSRLAGYYNFWIDTDPEDAGPELMVAASPRSPEWIVVNRAERFGAAGQKPLCSTQTAHTERRRHRLSFLMHWSCLGDGATPPASLRVSVQAWGHLSTTDRRRQVTVDWAPGRHRWSRWVQHG